MDAEEFWRTVKTNLQAGRIRLIFLADTIPSELARIVEFLNGQMDPAEVYAVEVPQFIGDGIQTLAPRVIGMTESARKRKSTGESMTRNWTRETYLDELEKNTGADGRGVGETIISWCEKKGFDHWYGKGSIYASYVPVDREGPTPVYIFGLYNDGGMEIKFKKLMNWPPFDEDSRRKDLLVELNSISGINLPHNSLKHFPKFQLEALKVSANLEWFLDILERCFTDIRRNTDSLEN